MPHPGVSLGTCTIPIHESNRKSFFTLRRFVAEADGKARGRGVFDLGFDGTSRLGHHEQLARSRWRRFWRSPGTIATLRSVNRRGNTNAEALAFLSSIRRAEKKY